MTIGEKQHAICLPLASSPQYVRIYSSIFSPTGVEVAANLPESYLKKTMVIKPTIPEKKHKT